MEEKNLNEQESLALIAEMIQSTKNYMNNDRGRWNPFLFYGLFTAVLGVVVCTLLYFTRNGMFCWLWALMFVPGIISKLSGKKRASAVTYTSKAIGSLWKVLGWMFVISYVLLLAMTFGFNIAKFMTVLMPLSLIYVSIGVSFTGVLLGERSVTYIPLFGLLTAFYLIMVCMQGQLTLLCMLAFSVTFLVVMFIPGWILKYKSGVK